jgi:hypothetical protein
MDGAMVHDDGGARLVLAQAGDQNLLQKRLKHRPIGGGGHGHDGDPTAACKRAEHRETAPVTGSAAVGLLAARRPCREPRQLGADSGLVDKDEVLGAMLLTRSAKLAPGREQGAARSAATSARVCSLARRV